MLPFRRILCPTDYSEAASAALEKACELARHFGAQLYVLHVVPPLGSEAGYEVGALPDFERERLDTATTELVAFMAQHDTSGVSVHTLVKMGNAPTEIELAAQQEEIDLIVISTHGTTGWRHLVFGKVTEKVLRQTHCPLLVVHPPQQ